MLNLTFYVSQSVLSDGRKQTAGLFSRISIISFSYRPINKRGGGISIFVKDSIRAKYLTMCSLSEDYMETLFIEINSGE